MEDKQSMEIKRVALLLKNFLDSTEEPLDLTLPACMALVVSTYAMTGVPFDKMKSDINYSLDIRKDGYNQLRERSGKGGI
jgi:hypothetical protein